MEKYSQQRQTRKLLAEQSTAHREERYATEIEHCVKATMMYDVSKQFQLCKEPVKNKPEIEMHDKDAVYSITTIPEKRNVAVLNFASFKNPGGGFIIGSKAQEEDLCRESILYNVLRRFEKTFYDTNRNDLNSSLYRSRGLYTPNVLFLRPVLDGTVSRLCSVITVACPNKKAYLEKNNGVDTIDANKQALIERCHFVLTIARMNNVKTLILGAYGCGVFGQDPFEVAQVWKYLLETYNFGFDKVIFAIPDKFGRNYQAFASTFRKG